YISSINNSKLQLRWLSVLPISALVPWATGKITRRNSSSIFTPEGFLKHVTTRKTNRPKVKGADLICAIGILRMFKLDGPLSILFGPLDRWRSTSSNQRTKDEEGASGHPNLEKKCWICFFKIYTFRYIVIVK
ncbi:unnamed protein product, partial [Nesidiocoris tenuis]